MISDEASDRKLVVFTMGLDDQSGLLKSTDVAPWSASSTISDSGSTRQKTKKGNRHSEPLTY